MQAEGGRSSCASSWPKAVPGLIWIPCHKYFAFSHGVQEWSPRAIGRASFGHHVLSLGGRSSCTSLWSKRRYLGLTWIPCHKYHGFRRGVQKRSPRAIERASLGHHVLSLGGRLVLVRGPLSYLDDLSEASFFSHGVHPEMVAQSHRKT